MAEAVAVVSIVANIIQLADFGTRVLRRLDEYQSSLTEIPEAFRHIKAELPVLLDALRQTKAVIDAGSLQDESKRALLPAVEGCNAQIKALDEVIEKSLPTSRDSWARRGRKALGSIRNDAKVEKITTIIRGYIQTLTYHAATSQPLAERTLPRPIPCSTVPFRRDNDFVSRDCLIEIHRICEIPAGRVGLVGLGGVGKSQIAIEYAYQVRERSPNQWVFWVHAGTQARFEDGYRRIAEATRPDGWDAPKADILRLVRSWLCDESNGQWLMIVDNADDSDVLFPSPPEQPAIAASNSDQAVTPLSDFLPQSPNGSILVTSRNQEVAYRLAGNYASIIGVQPMDEDDALALFEKKLESEMNEKDAIELIHLLDCMPLAVTQAAAFIRQRAPRMTISRYIDDLRMSDHDRARLLKKDVGDSRRDGRASNSIISTWQISFEYIRANMPRAAQLLSLMSLFDRQGIPESLLQDQYQLNEEEEADFDDDIYTLTDYSLIAIGGDGREFGMHRLVQFSTRTWLELNNELEQWKERFAMLMDDSYPKGEYENWNVCRALFPHAQALKDCQPNDVKALEAWASVLYKAAWYATEAGQYDNTNKMGSSALQVREAILGTEHSDTIASFNNLGLILRHQGQNDEAEAVFEKALEVCSRLLGTNHPKTLIAMSNLAGTYTNQGRLEAAEKLEDKSLKMRESILGKDHPDTLLSITNLAVIYLKHGRLEAAEEQQIEVIERCKRKVGAHHPLTMLNMNNLACTWKWQGRDTEAIKLMGECAELRRRILGPSHPDYLSSVNDLADWEREGAAVDTSNVDS